MRNRVAVVGALFVLGIGGLWAVAQNLDNRSQVGSVAVPDAPRIRVVGSQQQVVVTAIPVVTAQQPSDARERDVLVAQRDRWTAVRSPGILAASAVVVAGLVFVAFRQKRRGPRAPSGRTSEPQDGGGVPASVPVQRSLAALMDALHEIGERHPELFDTMVREAMGEALVAAIVAERPVGEWPERLGMFSDEGNQAIKTALAAYVAETLPFVKRDGMNSEERVAAIWDYSVISSTGETIDEYLGAI